MTMANGNQAATLSGTTKPEVLGVPQDYGLGNSQQDEVAGHKINEARDRAVRDEVQPALLVKGVQGH